MDRATKLAGGRAWIQVHLSPFYCARLQSTLNVTFSHGCLTSELPETDTKRIVGAFSPETPMRVGDNLWVKSVNSINMYGKPREWEAGTIAGAGGSGNDAGL